MLSRKVTVLLAVVAFWAASAAADTTAVATIIANIKKNTDKIVKYSAQMTLKELDSTSNCVSRSAKWEHFKPDTDNFWLQNGAGWIKHSSIFGDSGDISFPKYEAIFALQLMSDTFPNSWINVDIPVFTAKVTFENADSIVLRHMNSSVTFNYTVDKKGWVVRRIVAGGYDVYDVTYTWSMSKDSIYFPSAVKITQADLCPATYQCSNIMLNGQSITLGVHDFLKTSTLRPLSGIASAKPGIFTLTGERIGKDFKQSANLPRGCYIIRGADGMVRRAVKYDNLPLQ